MTGTVGCVCLCVSPFAVEGRVGEFLIPLHKRTIREPCLCPTALRLSVTGDDRKRLEGMRMITAAKGFEMPFVKWPFWCE